MIKNNNKGVRQPWDSPCMKNNPILAEPYYRLDKIYIIWLKYNAVPFLRKKFMAEADLLMQTAMTMRKYFEKNGDPRENEEWVKFSNAPRRIATKPKRIKVKAKVKKLPEPSKKRPWMGKVVTTTPRYLIPYFYLDKIYDIWIEYDFKEYLSTQHFLKEAGTVCTVYTVKDIIAYFERYGNPRFDQLWLDFHNKAKELINNNNRRKHHG